MVPRSSAVVRFLLQLYDMFLILKTDFYKALKLVIKALKYIFLKIRYIYDFFYTPPGGFLFTRVADPIELLFQTFSKLLSPFFFFHKTA